MVINAKQTAKWRQDLIRRIEAERSIDFYENRHDEYLRDLVDRRVDQLEADYIKKYLDFENLTERLINDMSILFRESPQITIVDASEQVQEKFNELKTELMIDATLRDVNKLVNLLSDVGVLPQIRNGEIALDIITPDVSFVEQLPDDPTKAAKHFYQVGISENSVYGDRIDVYHYWTIDGNKYSCTVNMQSGTIANEEQLPAPAYKEQPIVMFRNYIPRQRFYSDKKNAIVETNLQIDYDKTRLNIMRDYNLPQRIMLGMAENEDKKIGITFETHMPWQETATGLQHGDVKYIKPDFNVKEEQEMIIDSETNLATSFGLSSSSIKGGEFTSGYHLALSKAEILARNKEERPYYAKAIKDLFRIIFKACQYTDKYKILKPEMDINIDFGEITFEQDEMTKEQVRAMKIANKTASPVDFIMEDNPDLTYDEAIEVKNRINADINRFNPTERFTQALNENV